MLLTPKRTLELASSIAHSTAHESDALVQLRIAITSVYRGQNHQRFRPPAHFLLTPGQLRKAGCESRVSAEIFRVQLMGESTPREHDRLLNFAAELAEAAASVLVDDSDAVVAAGALLIVANRPDTARSALGRISLDFAQAQVQSRAYRCFAAISQLAGDDEQCGYWISRSVEVDPFSDISRIYRKFVA